MKEEKYYDKFKQNYASISFVFLSLTNIFLITINFVF